MYLYVEFVDTKSAYDELMMFDISKVNNCYKRVKRIKLTDEQLKELQHTNSESLYLLSLQEE
jgi:hypothetical protein